MAEFVARIIDQYSGPVSIMRDGTIAWRKELQGASDDLDAIQKKSGRPPPSGGSYKATSPRQTPAESTATKREAAGQQAGEREEARKARELGAAQKYVQGIRDRHFLKEQRDQERREAADLKARRSAEAQRDRELERKSKPGTPGSRLVAAGAAGGQKILDATVDRLKTIAGLAGAAYGAKELTQLALGYRGMERLAGITQRAQFRFRQLFAGIQPKPVLDTLERISFLFSKQTTAGRALGGLLERSFNGLFGSVKTNEPLILDFFKGLVLGALRVEGAWLTLRVALFPITNLLRKALNQVGVGAVLGQVAIVALTAKMVGATAATIGLGGAAAAAASKFVLIAAAAAAAFAVGKKAIDQIAKARDEKITKEVSAEGRRQNLITQARKEAASGGVTAQTRAKLESEKTALRAEIPKAGPTFFNTVFGGAGGAKIAAEGMKADLAAIETLTSQAGTKAGDAMSAGMVAGMRAGEVAVTAAGKGLARAADAGIRSEAQIKSPSRLTRRRGQQMGEGQVLGLLDMERPVQAAAERALVPDVSGASRTGSPGVTARSGRAMAALHVHIDGFIGDESSLEAVMVRVMDRYGVDILLGAGLDPEVA